MSFVTRRALSTLIPPKVRFSPADGSHHIKPYLTQFSLSLGRIALGS